VYKLQFFTFIIVIDRAMYDTIVSKVYYSFYSTIMLCTIVKLYLKFCYNKVLL